MTQDYENVQKRHYDQVASREGGRSSSTMPDAIIRERESEGIIGSLSRWLSRSGLDCAGVRMGDLGCGNGTTLSLLVSNFPEAEIVGIEYNKELLRIAALVPGAAALWGDLRDKASLPNNQFDVLLLQRVMINIQSLQDQMAALGNVVGLLKVGGLLVTIEAFDSGLRAMNEARKEFNLPSVQMPYHNLFLPDDFFSSRGDLERVDVGVPEHFLSTHYYLSYVVYPALASATGGTFDRNSVFVRMFSQMLPNVGEFGSNRFLSFRRTR